MKVKKQLKKLHELLDDDARERKHNRKDMKKLLRKMKEKERKLMDKLKLETDDKARERLQHKIDMLHAQRRKGIQTLRPQEEA